MHGIPTYADRAYARVVPGSNGMTVLQYWLFYYFNWHPYPPPTGGDHEGDWEMIQFEVDPATGVPVRSTYAQHGQGETCAWSFVERTATGRPVVYVARGSHASYFRSGYRPPQAWWNPGDYADGNATPVIPTVETISSTSPSWVAWPGVWGGSGSPPGPAGQGTSWSDPALFASGAHNCHEALFSYRTGGSSASAGSPPAPRIVATRVRDRVRIAYRFASWPRGENRPAMLLTAVQSSGTRYSPYMKRHRISARSGVVYQPLGLGKAPFKLHAASYSRDGTSSKTITVRVRGG
jgi:hypothetical protein